MLLTPMDHEMRREGHQKRMHDDRHHHDHVAEARVEHGGMDHGGHGAYEGHENTRVTA